MFVRLREMGLVPGTTVTLVRAAPMGDPLEIKVAAPDSDVGKAIRDVAGRRPGPIPMPYGSVRLGGVSIDGAYVYRPVAAPVAS